MSALHVDGFEGALWNRQGLPERQGYRIKFFSYAPSQREEKNECES
jgi:hypothetical protein